MVDGRAPSSVTLHRFFLGAESIHGDQICFPEEQSRQLERVLRLRAGDRVLVLDGSGTEREVVLRTVGKQAVGTVDAHRQNVAEPRITVDLYLGILKGSKFETVLQKGTEVGITRFIPVLTARSVPTEPSTAKVRRYEAIVREAAEQSRRGSLPAVGDVVAFDEALRTAIRTAPIILLWEDEETEHLMTVPLPRDPARVALFVGPEGGFTEEEVRVAREIGAQTASLGRRILRAETAGVVGPALLLARLGDLG